MPYYLTYQVEANNKRSNLVRVEIYRKDVDPGSPVTLTNQELTGVKVSYPQGEDSKYPSIVSAQADIALRVTLSSSITAETFLTDLYDEWKVIIYCDTEIVFAGFIEPSEGNYTMKDAPLPISIKCTDGLGLLKNIELSNVNEDSFLNTIPTLIEFICGALIKTNLDLNVRVYCSIYHSSMNDRGVSALYDMFSQAKTDYRTFLKNPTEFFSCYETLERILKEGFCLFQWKGLWVISYRPEMQGTIGPTNYYTEYDPTGAALSAAQDLSTQINIGFSQQQHPINLEQTISYQVPVKSVKHTYNYNVWDEIPKNNKFERGSLIFPLSGVGYSAFSIDDWDFGIGIGSSSLPTIGAATGTAYRKSSFNTYGIETSREILITTPSNSDQDWLQCKPIPVNGGDKIRISLDHKTDYSGTGNHIAFYVYLKPTSGSPSIYTLQENGNWLSGFTGVIHNYTGSENTQDYLGYDIESNFIPQDGDLYIAFHNAQSFASTYYYKNFSFEYFPFIAGSLQQIKGDYWRTAQNANVKDVIDEEVFLSDALKKVYKGALLENDGVTLTTPEWYRYGITETRHYKELLNLGKYRHYYRRYREITGTFRGVKCYSENDFLSFYPLCFHKHFKFVDNSGTKLHCLCPPVGIDYLAGRFDGTFIECFDTAGALGTVPETYTDSEQGGDTHEYKYIF